MIAELARWGILQDMYLGTYLVRKWGTFFREAAPVVGLEVRAAQVAAALIPLRSQRAQTSRGEGAAGPSMSLPRPYP